MDSGLRRNDGVVVGATGFGWVDGGQDSRVRGNDGWGGEGTLAPNDEVSEMNVFGVFV